MDRKLAERNCSEAACPSAAATSLDQQALCLKHFLMRCYAKLEALDPRGEKSSEQRADLAAMRAFIEECSRSTPCFCGTRHLREPLREEALGFTALLTFALLGFSCGVPAGLEAQSKCCHCGGEAFPAWWLRLHRPVLHVTATGAPLPSDFAEGGG